MTADTPPSEPRFADRMFDGFYAEGAVEDDYRIAVGALDLGQFLGELLAFIGWDHYDASIEIYMDESEAANAYVPTEELRDRVLAMGFVQGWVNWRNGDEVFFNKDGVGERHACPDSRWERANSYKAERRSETDALRAGPSRIARQERGRSLLRRPA